MNLELILDVNGGHRFHLYRVEKPTSMIGFVPKKLSFFEKEDVEFLEWFTPISSKDLMAFEFDAISLENLIHKCFLFL